MKLIDRKRRFTLGCLCAAAFTPLSDLVFAQKVDWPGRPLKIVVPLAAGSVADAIARLFAEGLSERLGQPIIVDNRPGANTIIGTTAVAKSPSDGYTILMGMTSLIQSPVHYKNVTYDPFQDFTPLGKLGLAASVLVVRSDKGVKNLDEMVKAARGKNWSYASSSTGPQVFMEMFNQVNGLGMTGVSYKGDSAAITDLIGGQIDCGLFSLFAVKTLARTGKVTIVGVVGDQRVSSLPNVPSFFEQGHKEVNYKGGWFAFFGPANLPPAISARLTRELKSIYDQPSLRKRLEEMDLILNWTDGPAFAPQMRHDMEVWRDLVKQSKVVIEQ